MKGTPLVIATSSHRQHDVAFRKLGYLVPWRAGLTRVRMVLP
jgi:hypothetical protein